MVTDPDLSTRTGPSLLAPSLGDCLLSLAFEWSWVSFFEVLAMQPTLEHLKRQVSVMARKAKLDAIDDQEPFSEATEGQAGDMNSGTLAGPPESVSMQEGGLQGESGKALVGGIAPDARPLRAMVMAILTLLWVEFLLGMYANLDVSFPPKGSAHGGMHVVMDHFGLMLHMVIGIILVILGMGATALAGKARSQPAMWLSLGGLVSLVAAGAGGLIFVLGDQSNAASYVMAVGFLAAFSCYFAELIATRHHVS